MKKIKISFNVMGNVDNLKNLIDEFFNDSSLYMEIFQISESEFVILAHFEADYPLDLYLDFLCSLEDSIIEQISKYSMVIM